ncbi:hypothetical protein MRB53_041575 [Persea americana]|nr:hypothetical protein MRB53_041575 [Persea americana]
MEESVEGQERGRPWKVIGIQQLIAWPVIKLVLTLSSGRIRGGPCALLLPNVFGSGGDGGDIVTLPDRDNNGSIAPRKEPAEPAASPRYQLVPLVILELRVSRLHEGISATTSCSANICAKPRISTVPSYSTMHNLAEHRWVGYILVINASHNASHEAGSSSSRVLQCCDLATRQSRCLCFVAVGRHGSARNSVHSDANILRAMVKIEEGTIPFAVSGVQEKCHTYYKTVGDIKAATPCIHLHGGPGASHLSDFDIGEPLCSRGIPSIFYDQIGCAKSSRLRERAEDESFWGFDLFCAQLDGLIDYFGLRETGFFVHGQSWGGMLAAVYAGRRPQGLRKLVLANCPASAASYTRELTKLFKALPVSDAVMQMDINEDYDTPEYQAASFEFMKKHFCRMDPWPAVFDRIDWEDGSTSMHRKNGKKNDSRLRLPGFQAEYDATKTAGNIAVPTLLLNGRYDWNNEASMSPLFWSIPRVKWAVLDTGHMSALEDPQRYLNLLTDFLRPG